MTEYSSNQPFGKELLASGNTYKTPVQVLAFDLEE